MPNLGDYLGQLFGELTLARLQADLESARIADLYFNHPLLRHFPVPRFRLPTVVLEVPLAIQGVEAIPEGAPPRGRLDLRHAGVAFEEVLEANLQAAGIELLPGTRASVEAALLALQEDLEQPAYVSESAVHTADV